MNCPHPELFHIRLPDGELQEVAGEVISLPGMEEFDLFTHLSNAGFIVLDEGKTGHMLMKSYNMALLMADAVEAFKNMKRNGKKPLHEQIAEKIAEFGLTPRWTR